MMWSLGRALTGRRSAGAVGRLSSAACLVRRPPGTRRRAEASRAASSTRHVALGQQSPRAESREPRACRPSLRPFLRHVALLLALASSPAAAQERLLDSFDSTAAWTAAPSDGVALRLAADSGYRGRGLRMDVDFHGGGGYAVARRKLPLELPANYALTFWIRGDVPPNNLEFKLVDPSGDNVWWV